MQKIENVIILKNGKQSQSACDIIVENGRVSKIIPVGKPNENTLFATAGFIDEHTHGGYGLDYFYATQEASDAVGKFHLDNGTTSFCATSVATKLDDLDKQIEEIRGLKNNYADMIGLHLEGPFISIKKKGAQPEDCIKTEFEEADKKFFEKNKDILKIVTLCPRTKNAPELVKTLVENNIIAHAGHDDSIYPEIIDCVNQGLSGATHIYCASSGMGRRSGDLTKYIGLNETALMLDNVMTEVIGDNIHISEPLFKYILKNKTYKNVILISDSLSASGMPVGNYKLGRTVDVYNNGSVAMLADLSALAGSVTPVSKAVKIAHSYGIPIAEAVYMGNEAPAKHLKLTDKGVLEEGKKADICILDKDANLIAVYKDGIKR